MLMFPRKVVLSLVMILALVACAKLDGKRLTSKKNDPGIDGSAVVAKNAAMLLGGSEELTKSCNDLKGHVSNDGNYCAINLLQKKLPQDLPLYAPFSIMAGTPAGVAVYVEGKDIPGGSLQLAVDGSVIANLPASTRHIVIPNKGEVQLFIITHNYSGVVINVVQCKDHNMNDIICPTTF